MRNVILCALLGLLAACGGKVVMDGPGDPSGGGGSGGGGSEEPCVGFNRWCAFVKKCSGATTCQPHICDITGGAKGLQCIADLPDDATCQQVASCTGG